MKMKSKKGKNMLALLLAFAMIVTGIVVTPVNAQAAKKEKKATIAYKQSVHEGVHHRGRPCKNKKRLFFKQNLMFWISFTPFLHQIRNPLYDI